MAAIRDKQHKNVLCVMNHNSFLFSVFQNKIRKKNGRGGRFKIFVTVIQTYTDVGKHINIQL